MISISGFLLSTRAYVICPQKFKVSHSNGQNSPKSNLQLFLRLFLKNFSQGPELIQSHYNTQMGNFSFNLVIGCKFYEYIFIFYYIVMYIFLSQICFGTTQYKLKRRNLFLIEFFMLWTTILCKKFGKRCSKIIMVEVQTWTPMENNIM